MSRNGIREGETCADDDRPLADDARTSDQRVETVAADAAEVTCLGNTSLSNRSDMEALLSLVLMALVRLDWYEAGLHLRFDEEKDSPLKKALLEAYELAGRCREAVPISLNGYRCLVHPGGLGRGKQTHLRIRITCGDVTLGIDFRNKACRRFHNCSLTIPGKACLIRGALEVREWAHSVIADLGAEIIDEWIRRIDVCIDIPGLDPLLFLIPCLQDQFVSTTSNHKIHFSGHIAQTFTLTADGRLVLQIYNKLKEVKDDNDAPKLAAMRDLRWGGAIPALATRIELRILRDWLSQWECDQAQPMLDNLGAIVARILTDEKPFFRMLQSAPDRKNGNQGKCPTHPLWEAVCGKLIADSGKQDLEFKKIRWGTMSQRRAFSMIKSYLIRCSVERRKPIHNIADAKEELEQLSYLNDANDWTWHNDWNRKANEYGLPGTPSTFDDGDVPF